MRARRFLTLALALCGCVRAGFDGRDGTGAGAVDLGDGPPREVGEGGDGPVRDALRLDHAASDAAVPLDGPPPPQTSWTPMASGTTEGLRAVWGSGPADVYAVGGYGVVLHYDGNAWSTVSVPTGEILRGVWGSGPSDVFVTGDSGHIVHYDGSAWTKMACPTSEDLRGVWGSGPAEIYVVGLNGTMIRYDGSAWSTESPGTTSTLMDVWGSGPGGTVFAVGFAGAIVRRVGTGAWQSMASGTTAFLYSVWGSGPSDVYAVSGTSGQILRHDGASWSAVSLPWSLKSNEHPGGVWGTAPDNVYFPGEGGTLYHLGASWTRIDTGATHILVDMWGSGGSLFIVGQAGLILH